MPPPSQARHWGIAVAMENGVMLCLLLIKMLVPTYPRWLMDAKDVLNSKTLGWSEIHDMGLVLHWRANQTKKYPVRALGQYCTDSQLLTIIIVVMVPWYCEHVMIVVMVL